MLRSLCLPLLGLALLAETAVAQTTPATRSATRKTTTTTKRAAPRQVPNTSPAARRADPLRGTNNNGAGNSGYAAPGEPITPASANGKNMQPYDGPAAPRNTTISTPK